MKKRPPISALIFMETDLEKAKPFKEEELTEVQRRYFENFSETEKEKIRAGYAAILAYDDGEKRTTLCEFNMEGYMPPQHSIDAFARSILPLIKEFYSKEENIKAYEEWKRNKENKE